jgi:hypothetical protein
MDSNIDVVSFSKGTDFCSGYIYKDFYVDGAVLIRNSTIIELRSSRSLKAKERIGINEGILSELDQIRQPVGLGKFLNKHKECYLSLHCEKESSMYWGLIDGIHGDSVEIHHWDGVGKYMGIFRVCNDEITMIVSSDRYSLVFSKYIEEPPNKSIHRRPRQSPPVIPILPARSR